MAVWQATAKVHVWENLPVFKICGENLKTAEIFLNYKE